MKNSGNQEIQWIMKFHGNKLQTFQEFPHQKEPSPQIHLTVGTKANEDSKASLQQDLDSKRKAIESLEGIVEACKDFKESSKEILEKQTDEATKSMEVAQNLKSLFQLILEFTKIMRKLRHEEEKPPPQDS